ncbi:MAG: mechanosensitive ion channel [Leptospiraceae bacterium]|nr:mechanosensitive ion channel [Leptospiraceae bacterium]MCP5493392.1 mechanosensitive ion channel [Leptospiraceae bacterium]
MDFLIILEKFERILTIKLFSIGQTEVSFSSLMVFCVLLIFFVLLSRFIARRIIEKLLTRLQLEQGMRYTIRRVTEYSLVIIGAIIAFQTIGINLSGLAVIFGLLSVGIGFGLQNITSNFIAGLILLFERPIKVGDRVTVGEIEGDIIEINIRSTTIRSLTNIAIIVPNSEFVSSRVINWSYENSKIRVDIYVGVSYNSDLDLVLDSLKQVALENGDVLQSPSPEVHLRSFGDSSWNMCLRIWINNPKRYYYVISDINCAIVRKFRENSIEIPFPQRDLNIRSPLPIPISEQVKNKS